VTLVFTLAVLVQRFDELIHRGHHACNLALPLALHRLDRQNHEPPFLLAGFGLPPRIVRLVAHRTPDLRIRSLVPGAFVRLSLRGDLAEKLVERPVRRDLLSPVLVALCWVYWARFLRRGRTERRQGPVGVGSAPTIGTISSTSPTYPIIECHGRAAVTPAADFPSGRVDGKWCPVAVRGRITCVAF